MKNAKISLTIAFLAAPALAQTNGTFVLTSSNTVSPTTPTTTIEIWATWIDPTTQFMFAASDYDLTARDGVFSNPINVLNGPRSSTGIIAGNVISGAINRQLTFCGFAGCPDDNPILLATYDWTTADFTPRVVDLRTSNTSTFLIATELFRPNFFIIELFPNEFTPGSGVINVVPAPAALLVLALPLVAATRRRRC